MVSANLYVSRPLTYLNSTFTKWGIDMGNLGTMGTKLEDGQAISGCKQTGGTIIVDKDPAKLRFRNKYTQEVRWTVEANSPNMNGGKISWNVAVIPQFEANFPHGPNGDQYMVDGELRDTM